MRFLHRDSELLVHTPSKLNLSLDVLGRRPDGYHELETVMVSVRLCDTLNFRLLPASDAAPVALTVHELAPGNHAIPLGADNLIVRAALLLRERTQSDFRVRIELTKRIPSEAGMGGGSSDAAATLVALNALAELRLSSAELHALAAELGSDLNFFLDSWPAATCTSRGEHLSPLELNRPLHFVIVKPPTGLSTGKVFARWGEHNQPHSRATASLVQSLRTGSLQELAGSIANSLTASACELNPDLTTVLNQLSRADVLASEMTGSGSACFGLCRSARQAQRLANKLRHWNLGQVWAVSTGV